MINDLLTISGGAERSAKIKSVYYTGALVPPGGFGVCYDLDYAGTAVGNGQAVQTPSSSNNLAFAGIVEPEYGGTVGPRWIKIAEPGSVCYVAVGGGTKTINATRMTCSASAADAGRFTMNGLPGRGSAIALQTSVMGAANAEGLLYNDMTGVASAAAYAAGVRVITDATGDDIGTACGYVDAAVTCSDIKLVLLGGVKSDSTDVATPAVYDVYQATAATTISVASLLGNLGTTATLLAGYVIKGNPQILAYLEDGEESGLQEVVVPVTSGTVSGMVGGTTYIAGGYEMAADNTDVVADSTFDGLKKVYCGLGTLTTKDYVVDPASGLQADVSTELVTAKIDAAAEYIMLEWYGSFNDYANGAWVTRAYNGLDIA